MGYSAARTKLSAYRNEHIASLLGETASSWFTSLWGSITDMLKSFDSEKENQEIAASYASGSSLERVAGHIRLDYVCGLRREVRKQYVSEDGDLCTDVTPFRHGVISAHGAQMFDNLLETVMGYSEQQAAQAGGNVA